MPAATSMKKNKFRQAKVSTNLEKKTRQKIGKMTSGDSSSAAGLLKDLKMLGKLKKCHVRVARLGKNTLGKVSKKKEKPKRKVKASMVRGSVIKKKPETRGRPRKIPDTQQLKPDNILESTENKSLETRGRKRKAVTSPPSNKRNKDEKKKRQIFIRLPFLETAKLKSLNKELIEKHYNKKAPPIKRLGKSYLTEKFGSRYFRCHVKVARYRDPNDPAPQKKEKFNRKSVSFVETVEVFGESDDDLSQVINSPRTATPAQEICNRSNDSIAVSPSRRKVSLLKKTESPRSEHMRRSDEKVPRVKEIENSSSDIDKDLDGDADTDALIDPEESPIVSHVDLEESEDIYLHVDETEHEVLPEDERMEEEEEEETEQQKQEEKEEKEKEEQEDEEEIEKEEEEEVASKSPEDAANTQADDVSNIKDDDVVSIQADDDSSIQANEVVNKLADDVSPVSVDETPQSRDYEVETQDKVEMDDNDDEKESENEKENQSKKNSDKEESENEKQNHSGTNSDDEDMETFKIAPDKEQQNTSHTDNENDRETSNDLPVEQPTNSGNNNNSNHIELSSASDHDSNLYHDIVDNELEMNTEIFNDNDDQEKEFSLQMSNNSETSALCSKSEQNDPGSDSVLSNLDNIDAIVDERDDTSDRPTQQTKFSLNTFFKSLKSKIISQHNESIPPTKAGSQCKEHEGDQTLRDELTIK